MGEANLQIADRGADIREPAGPHQALSWEPPHQAPAHRTLPSPPCAAAMRAEAPVTQPGPWRQPGPSPTATTLPQLFASEVKPFRKGWGEGITREIPRCYKS